MRVPVEKDDYRFQQARLERITSELNPNWQIEFEPDVTKRISFRVVDRQTGKLLGSTAKSIWLVSVIADKPDVWVSDFIRQCCAGSN